MGRIKKFGVSAAAVAAIAAATTLMSPTAPAQAATCSTSAQIGISGGTGWAMCSGTGVTQTRVLLFCQNSSGIVTTVYGPWVANSVKSNAQCSSNSWPASVGHQRI
ncbi:hypothetical protein FHS43_001819 [Streptosporangium becharense]|uniref:Uncharacterized protein n=1 Tax=Streptosporangium becharense TaxID=1816182 RepID=A0A7W9INJ0_9ACTN|nr:hypothetical protein [Streptosporangium becharense]MBB2910556.1 hypothetical protein [Streptosporangium becharense]MBB5823299.1 hypothetical protein [Streptosporangium becharense]